MLEVIGTAESSLLEVLGYVCKLCSYKRLHLLIHSSSDSSTREIPKFYRMKDLRWYLTVKPVSWSHGSILWMQNILFRLIIWPFALKYPTKKSLDFWLQQIMYLTFKSKYVSLEEVSKFFLAHLLEGSQLCKYNYCWLAYVMVEVLHEKGKYYQ